MENISERALDCIEPESFEVLIREVMNGAARGILYPDTMSASQISRLAKVLKKNLHLEIFSLLFCYMEGESLADFIHGLRENYSIKQLGLAWKNAFRKAASESLERYLRENETLRLLCIRWLNRSATYLPPICTGLKVNSTLESLDLSSCDIGRDGSILIGEMLEENKHLTSLNIASCKIGTEGAVYIANGLKENVALQFMSLDKNEIGKVGGKAIKAMLIQNTCLVQLSMNYNSLGDAGVKHVAEALRSNTTLTSLRMNKNGITLDGLRVLVEALKQNRVICDLPVKKNNFPEVAQSIIEFQLRKNEEFKRQAYFDALKDEKGPWQRGKLMIVGEAMAGKTATVRSLLNLSFEPRWRSTRGIVTHNIKAYGNDSWTISNEREYTKPLVNRIAVNHHREIIAEDLDEYLQENTTNRRRAQRRSLAWNNFVEESRSHPEQIVQEQSKLNYNEKEFYEAQREGDGISMSIWDYGGQTVFHSLHHIFLTKYGVYLLVFNMQIFLEQEEECVQHLFFWIKSINLHAPGTPIMLIGTHSEGLDRERFLLISESIAKLVSKALSVVKNEDSFIFPTDNKTKSGLQRVRQNIGQIIRQQPYFHMNIPIKWIKSLDKLNQRDESWLTYDEVQEVFLEEDLSASSFDDALRFFHEFGLLFHFTSTDVLQQVITIKPQWLIDSMSKIIRDRCHEFDPEEIEANGLKPDIENLFEKGLVSEDLLEILWGKQQVQFLIDLMLRLLLVSKWTFANEGLFLVPCMLQEPEEGNPIPNSLLSRAQRGQFRVKFPYLPDGIFERVECICIDYSAMQESTIEPIVRKGFLHFWMNKDTSVYLRKEGNEIIVAVDSVQTNAPKRILNMIEAILVKIRNDLFSKEFTWECFSHSHAEELNDQENDKTELSSTNIDQLFDNL